MSVLEGKKVLLGVTAGIAAYKTAPLVRLFIKAGARVKVIMTPAAKDFVTPLTLSTLSKNEVISSFTREEEAETTWNNHVELGLWADFMLIAPATANTLSKMAAGASDNFLLATYLSAKCPVYFAPAMDLDMYRHPATAKSFETLQSYGNIMIPAEAGELASGLEGEGRMAEPENIISFISRDLAEKLPLRGKTILITAGPTYEAIDPVRFIGNHSSGKMGFALAEEAAALGAGVVLVSGPTHLDTKNAGVRLIRVTSAREMYEAVHEHFEEADVVIAAAAVADYKPRVVAAQKMKKKDAVLNIELEPTQDILASLGEAKKNQKLIGFALETNDELKNAKAKLKRKNLDFIVLNSMNEAGAGFKKDTNKISIVSPTGVKDFELKPKSEVAKDILNEVILLFNE
ncbi:bifunctional phosphopantothenoylcysteine decarboxylase/phosphopantothenate--cysteine ligase CoaBC [Antarcticibacterium flavum]|uniref:Coenzyme A biosynthesis bifunctional protein CoaBC n=1 Tax=Antarcticibacterium flavum TaxID=2058175 RepID=A0A5B7X5P2_9FLAO|nr:MULTISPECIES: bifunctional phosphopantothenoylcysteine decarboxylase/phosphopantothenate--cysteine ligase CoaBC [Antarcticibacterium]MCM4161063.1 bifunctional phosphopantothenoylcysteine decarboxylase/phosphopantothenate--cysteine ligase CoaBC [Antarcticibacterium sp. W02-3]QCY70510.1 bifunctional phosphopantothenoylcysteine decarboxylase/phosphopantothenate--cysteine ligase CoaBC [Antarcticibacterium flavum]